MKVAEFVKTRLLGLPGLSGALFGGFFFMILASAGSTRIFNSLGDSDTCWLLKTGLWILQHHAIPFSNPFSNGIPALEVPLVSYQWLFELLLGLAYQWAALPGVVWLVASCFGLSIMLLTLYLYERDFKAGPEILMSILLATLTLASLVIARPILISLLFSAFLLWSWSKRFQPRTYGMLYPPMFALWCNMHLAFISGLIMLGVLGSEKALTEKTKWPLGLVLACVLAALLNPFGAQLWVYFAGLADSPFMNASIVELTSPNFHTKPLYLVFVLLEVLAACLTFGHARIRQSDRILFLLGLGCTLYSQRHTYLLALFGLPFTACALESVRDRLRLLQLNTFTKELERPWLWVLGISLAGALMVNAGFIKADFPKAAGMEKLLSEIRELPKDRPLLTNEIWGSYLIFYSDARSLLDTRMDMYGDRTVQKWSNTLNLQPGWQKNLDDAGVNTLIYPAKAWQLEWLLGTGDWQVRYQDSTAVVLERTQPITRAAKP